MSKQRERRGPEPGEFRDPLKNYEPPEYGDEFERSLCEDTIDVIDRRPYTSVAPATPVRDALRLMAEQNIACLVVTDGEDRPVGVLTEQDVTQRIAPRYHEAAHLPVGEVMTPGPLVVYESETPARALNVMGTGSFRHLPVCDVDGKLIGVIGARRVIAYLQQYVA
jgi:CBS domain-containing protein